MLVLSGLSLKNGEVQSVGNESVLERAPLGCLGRVCLAAGVPPPARHGLTRCGGRPRPRPGTAWAFNSLQTPGPTFRRRVR